WLRLWLWLLTDRSTKYKWAARKGSLTGITQKSRFLSVGIARLATTLARCDPLRSFKAGTCPSLKHNSDHIVN
ncbi:MAG: hypothetical protein IIU58_05965, partial [Clostridia bacterium]|nr:hypothetical protein [Clostridia bacterium]